MKIFAISDLHISTNTNKPMDVFGGDWVDYIPKIFADWEAKVGDDDLVLIGGDISWAMDIKDAEKDIQTLSHLKGKKIFIKGNHDYWWSGINKVRDILPNDCFALQNDSIRFDGVVVCGSRLWAVPGSPNFSEQDQKLYNRERERLILSLKNAKKIMREGDKLIALIHFPPFNVHREDNDYTKLFEEYGVNTVVYGHLHGKSVRADLIVKKNGITYYLTSCDQVKNQLIEIKF